jgi:hypothetical protein
LIINCDFITEPGSAAVIVAQAFKEKFAAELEGKPFELKNNFSSVEPDFSY